MALDPTIAHRIRVLIPDAEAIYGIAGNEYMFSDEDLEAYYAEGFENTKCAAGLAKMAIGASEALVLKVIKNYETSTNGAALLKEWTAAAERLYDMGLAEIADADAEEGIFEVVYPDFGYSRHPEGYSHGSYQTGGWF
jgi:hypothetical protein